MENQAKLKIIIFLKKKTLFQGKNNIIKVKMKIINKIKLRNKSLSYEWSAQIIL